ncbi:hypothetical protein [Seonamhaeicola marinus]|uniref:Uncharacterized protein n=1 Tax=Seonamhaeicola marinus TaxID=1912246 RepID=A0A5D0HKD5_9FLAO|nr:hypothetical protein [Seonamhaeicola marinus]TYA71758.1 hypothetical protein FUA24_19590 [Seonamhaeicola marinus]
MSITELLISFSIIMMMLSFVSERLSNLIKLYYQDKTIFIPYPHKTKDNQWKCGLKAKLRILANKQPTIQSEKQREYRVLVINILVGIIIAVFSNANFFQLVKSISSFKGKQKENLDIILGWKINQFDSDLKYGLLIGGIYLMFLLWSISLILFNQLVETRDKLDNKTLKWPLIYISLISIFEYLYIISCDCMTTKQEAIASAIFEHTVGFIITGLFLSLGSKFWHDLLDLLFKFKNVQQRLNQKSTYTDYDSPKKILSLATTSEYEVVDRLMDKYYEKIRRIKGVVSVGKNTYLDENTGLFRKIIEVEFTIQTAQEELYKLTNTGSITIDYNTFYLKDYLRPLYTSKLVALIEENNVAATSNWIEDIKHEEPVCYAYNVKNKSNLGSFRIFKEGDGSLYAESNFHVFASKNDLEQANKYGQSYNVKDKFVKLKIGDNDEEDAIITEFSFGEGNGTLKDYCKAKLSSNDDSILKKYNEHVDRDWLLKNEKDKMKMFGATTKGIFFWEEKLLTHCSVEYSSFKKEFWLYKIKTRADHIDFGDSGSILYYYDDENRLKKGMVVAKSDTYAYMFDINN